MQAEERYGPGGYIYVGNGGYEVRLLDRVVSYLLAQTGWLTAACIPAAPFFVQAATGLPQQQPQGGQGYGAVQHSG